MQCSVAVVNPKSNGRRSGTAMYSIHMLLPDVRFAGDRTASGLRRGLVGATGPSPSSLTLALSFVSRLVSGRMLLPCLLSCLSHVVQA